MKQARKKKPISAEAIARMADQGKDISRCFTNQGRMVYPIQRVNVDFTTEMLAELDREAAGLNISRQAVIKTLVREGLDRRYPRRPSSGLDSPRVRSATRSRRAATK
jgi:hypothetical protein